MSGRLCVSLPDISQLKQETLIEYHDPSGLLPQNLRQRLHRYIGLFPGQDERREQAQD